MPQAKAPQGEAFTLQPSNPQPTTLRIQASHGVSSLHLKAVWEYRELLYFLVWRDVKVRYKQTALGVAWVVLQPILSTVVFTVIFGVLLNAPSAGVPYPVFVLAGLLPWTYFAGSLSRTSTSLVNSANLITKVYFPRLVIPLSAVLSGLVDFAVTFVVLVVLMVVYRIAPTPGLVLLPLFLLLAIVTALGFGLWMAALNVRYRDVTYLVPFLLQIWMYLTPVVYASTLIPERFRWLLALNPMAAVVMGFRWSLLGGTLADAPPTNLLLISTTLALVVLATGAVFFRSTERTFADVI